MREHIVEALADTRGVVVVGARQVGKSTLVEQIAAVDHPARVITLDDLAIREAAAADPTGFIGELAGVREAFIPTLFRSRFPTVTDAPVGRHAYAERMAIGGYPAVQQRSPRRRTEFFESYVDTIIQRDVSTIARVHDQTNLRRLLEAIAATSGSLMKFGGLSRDLGLNANTLRSRTDLLETLFLALRVPSWHSNLLSRIVNAPKAHIADSGLLCSLAGFDARRKRVQAAATEGHFAQSNDPGG